MSDFYLIKKTTLDDIEAATQEKTGVTTVIPVLELGSKIRSITGGGSAVDVKYISFKSEDGTSEYLKKPVTTGDHCADVVASGLLAAPTKESDVQYDYTHAGWSDSIGGSISTSVFQNVTEDRNVYAKFSGTLRYYTVQYYDGETLLHTESLAYGSTPNYVPDGKDGYLFDGWTTDLVPVTGDTVYYAKWAVSYLKLADYTWSEIVAFAENGQASRFEPGDRKPIWVSAVSMYATLIGVNHDDLADGSGKAGMTFRLEKAITPTGTKESSMYMNDYYDTSFSYWGDCDARYDSNADTSSLFYWIGGNAVGAGTDHELFKSAIKTVKKKCYNGSSIVTTEDKVWLESLSELGFSDAQNEGECYPVYSGGKSLTVEYAELIRETLYGSSYSSYTYWVRSIQKSGPYYWYTITNKGLPKTATNAAMNNYTMYWCFCI